jgi:hypothetical protein
MISSPREMSVRFTPSRHFSAIEFHKVVHIILEILDRSRVLEDFLKVTWEPTARECSQMTDRRRTADDSRVRKRTERWNAERDKIRELCIVAQNHATGDSFQRIRILRGNTARELHACDSARGGPSVRGIRTRGESENRWFHRRLTAIVLHEFSRVIRAVRVSRKLSPINATPCLVSSLLSSSVIARLALRRWESGLKEEGRRNAMRK